ncbi:VOC family protein [Metabacillus litoralis]|uniref:VOC family protein n=1 Tax=Metabacillus litoralis TaxID=152268 RepID=UPI001BA3C3D6|nr:VOC family protein [Metabacillus litoralis]UHA58498.1 VOC family protein [Metabacillus litoralis]
MKKELGGLEDITGVTCIYILVKDVYESVKWYQKNLGCEPTIHNPVSPGMQRSILRFPDHNGDILGPGLRQTTPAIFLVTDKTREERVDHAVKSNNLHPLVCFITPRIQEMYNRFIENGVEIVDEISEDRSVGDAFKFYDLDRNLLEIWQP